MTLVLVPISALPSASPLSGSELLAAVQGGETVKVSISDIFSIMGSSPVSASYSANTTQITYSSTAGDVVWNNASQSSATQLFFAFTDKSGNAMGDFLDNNQVGDTLYLVGSDVGKYQEWLITAKHTSVDHQTFTVTLIFSNHDFANGENVNVVFQKSSSSGTVTSVSGVAANGFTWSIPNPTTTPALTIDLQNADATHDGKLIQADWVTFKNSIRTDGSNKMLGNLDINGFDIKKVYRLSDLDGDTTIDNTNRQLIKKDGNVQLDWEVGYFQNINIGTNLLDFSSYVRIASMNIDGVTQAVISADQDGLVQFISNQSGSIAQLNFSHTYGLSIATDTGLLGVNLKTDNVTTNYTVQMPNKGSNQTFAMISDIPTVAGVYMPITGGTFTGAVTLSADAVSSLQPVTLQQLQSQVAGLWDDRGNFTPSGSYPSTGGSGTGGAILKGDIWTITGLGSGISGTMGARTVYDGYTVRALVDSPGSTNANWATAENGVGYIPLSNTLNSANIFVGNASNNAIGVAVTGDITISNTGVTAIGSGKVVNAMIANSTIDLTAKVTGLLPDSNIASATNWNTAYTNRITSLTTTGASGSATLASNVLNIPTYTLAGLGGFANPMSAVGDIIIGGTSGSPTRLAAGTNGFVLTLSSGSPVWAAAAAASPLTTKGDLYTYSTVNAKLGVGTDGQGLFADSTQTTGLKWRNIANSDLPTYTAVNDFTVLSGANDLQTIFNKTAGSLSVTRKEIGTRLINNWLTSGELSSYTPTGTATWTFATPGVTITGGTGVYTTNYFTPNSFYTLSDKYTLTIEFNSTTAGNGIAIGFTNLYARVDLNTAGNRGKIFIDNTVGNLATSTTALTFTNTSDTLRLSLRRDGNTVWLRLENVTTPANLPVEVQYTQVLVSGNQSFQAIGPPTIYAYGGTQVMTKFKYDINALQKCKIGVLSDSNGEGYYQDTNSWLRLLQRNFNDPVIRFCRYGALCSDINNALSEITSSGIEYALINIGTNNARNGDVLATYMAQLATLMNGLIAAGIKPILISIIPNSVSGTNTLITSYNTNINSTYGGVYTYVDTFTAQALAGLYNPIYNDGVHMTPLGGLNFYTAVYKALLNLSLPMARPISVPIQSTDRLVDTNFNTVIDFNGSGGSLDIWRINTAVNSKVVSFIAGSSTADNYFTLTNGIGTAGGILGVAGVQTNISLKIQPKGTGQIMPLTAVAAGGTPVSFQNLTATAGEYLWQIYSNGTNSTSNKVGLKFSMNNASGSAAVNSYITAQTVTVTAGSEDSKLLFDNIIAGTRTTAFTIDRLDALFAGNVTLSDAKNIITGATTGTKIGTAVSQKIGLWNATPIVQPTTSITGAIITANSGTAVNDASTFAGYTIGQIVAALRSMGALA